MPKQPLKPGRAKCLKCGNLFDSRDVRSNRICLGCQRINSKEYVPRIISSRVYADGGKAGTVSHDN